MPLALEDRAFLKELFSHLDPNLPLEPDNPFYQPLYEMPGCEDPVDLLHRHIEFSGGESRQLFTGFRGSGKTTELLRLKRDLEAEDYLVFYANALDYINQAQPIDITDLLIVIAGAFSDAVEAYDPAIRQKNDSYWNRFLHYLTTTQVNLEEVKLTAIKDVAELKLALKDAPTFRQRLQEFMGNRLIELEGQVKKFFEDYVKALQAKYPDRPIVFILDNLEQIRGSLFTERDVIQSVERLFTLYLDRLNLPYVHVIYTFPPWIRRLRSGAEVVILHTICQWKKDQDRSPNVPGNQCLLGLLQKRFGPGGLARFFGQDERAYKFIDVCGGHIRDLLRLCIEAIIRAKELPVTEEVIQLAISRVRSSFLPIAADDALWLRRVADSREPSLPDTSSESIARFTRFLDTHFVLYIRNGEDWYDIHPLIRSEVMEIAQSASVS